eukprot:TRINITY_DN394_c0_g1_i1.p1 TRINITY_DN394_c0_g1~~TRINITY_DN394_c0_g1_i1.p1  ORF type:complete len:268 (-),score=61.53 TRINITY_DN394_c0_g1_i1:303-1106(-)
MASRLFFKVVALPLAFLSCRADEAEKTESHLIDSFDNLQVSSALNVNVTVNSSLSSKDAVMKITALEKNLHAISAYVVPSLYGGTLYLSANPYQIPYSRHGSTIGSVTLEVPEPLNWINANSAASVVVDQASGDLSADSRGSLEVKEVVQPKSGAEVIRTVFFRASSAGTLKVDSGEMVHAFVQASSAAVIDLAGLSVGHARIEASSSATVTVHATKSAALTCSSSAAVTVTGIEDVQMLYTRGCSVTAGTADGKKNVVEDTNTLFP